MASCFSNDLFSGEKFIISLTLYVSSDIMSIVATNI